MEQRCHAPSASPSSGGGSFLRRLADLVRPSRFDPPAPETVDPELLKRVRATNLSALGSLAITTFAAPAAAVFLVPWTLALLAVANIVYASALLLNRAGHLDAGRLVYGLGSLACILLFYPVVGHAETVMCLPSALAAFVLFSSEEPRYRRLLIACSAAAAAGMLLWSNTFGDPSLIPPDKRGLLEVLLYAVAGMACLAHMASLDRESSARQQELSAAAAAAQQASGAKEAFLANMSHELRTPMNGVIGMTSMLRTTQLDSKQRHMIDVVHNSGEALLVLLNDVLDLAKMRTGTFQLRPETTALHEVLQQVGGLFRANASDKGVTLDVVIGDHVPTHVLVDSTRLRQLLSNLVGNAVKFTAVGRVELRAEVVGEELLSFTVADTGPGIPASTVARLFEPFEQLDDGHDRAHGGTGLGLAIVKQLTEAMDGSVAVEAIVDEGATFTVHLPLPSMTPLPPRAARRAPRAGASALIIDDDVISRRVTQSMLAHLGLSTHLATNADECLAALKAETFDLVLLDLQSHAFDAAALARHVRAMTSATRTKLCGLLTRGADARSIDGLDGSIDKPVHLEALEQLVTDQLGDRPAPRAALATAG